MKYIAHRGNVSGPNSERENSPAYIKEAIQLGFDVEIDVWLTDTGLHLGHDRPQYKIDDVFLTERVEKLWCHAKNQGALEHLLKMGMHTFWHQNDDYTITSKGIVWAYPDKATNGIYVMPERYNTTVNKDCVGVCSDFVECYKYSKNIY